MNTQRPQPTITRVEDALLAEEAAVRRDYANARIGMPEGHAVTLLHIGADQTLIATGTGLDATLIRLAMGAQKTAADCFRHHPPTPGEMENAIMVVEDVLAPARAMIGKESALHTTDSNIREIALLAGLADQPKLALSIEAVEQTFERLASVVQGKPAAIVGMPADARFAASLLILREFLHHMQFASMTITR
ncbi:MAG: hypothetical protein P4L87_12455 [Formivibrio sp.]|nr:hypothetical protein [Formivibrio sp.]